MEIMDGSGTVQMLISLLKECERCEDNNRLNEVSVVLLEAQKQPGYCQLLHNLAKSNLEESVKIGVLLQYKAIVYKYWNQRDGYIISDNEKEFIRQSLISLLSEENRKIINIVDSILMAIVRVEFPDLWPNIFSVLMDRVQKSNQKSRARMLQITLVCVKAVIKDYDYGDNDDKNSLATKRNKLKRFSEIGPAIMNLIVPLWMNAITQMLQLLSDFCQRKLLAEELAEPCGLECVLSAKIISLILIRYLPQFNVQNESDMIKLLESVMFFLQTSIECRRATQDIPNPLQDYLEKTIITLVKLFYNCQYNHPLTFVPILVPCFDYFFNQYKITNTLLDAFWEKYYVQILNFFANAISSREYRETPLNLKQNRKDAEDREPVIDEKVIQGQTIVNLFFNVETTMTMMNLLIFRYLQLTPELLELWETDPEALLEEEISDAYLFKITPSAEYFFYRLLLFNEAISEPLLSLILDTLNECKKITSDHPHFLKSVLIKDSCYYAISLSGGVLADTSLDFKHFLMHYILPDFNNNHHYSYIIKRRIAMVLEYWVPEIRSCRGEAYKLAAAILCDKDLVVRVHGATALRSLIEDFDFDSGKYLQFIRPSLSGIINLVSDMSGSATTCHILNLITVIITTLGEQSRPYMYDIMQCVSVLWKKSRHQKMVIANIIRILGTLVEVLVGGAAELEEQLLPVIALSCDPYSQDSLYILEEGLILWSNMIEQSGFLSENLKALFPAVLVIAETNRDDFKVLRKLVHLVECNGTLLWVGNRLLPYFRK